MARPKKGNTILETQICKKCGGGLHPTIRTCYRCENQKTNEPENVVKIRKNIEKISKAYTKKRTLKLKRKVKK